MTTPYTIEPIEIQNSAFASEHDIKKDEELEKERAQQAAEEEESLRVMQRIDMYEKLGVNPFSISDDPFDLRSDYAIL